MQGRRGSCGKSCSLKPSDAEAKSLLEMINRGVTMASVPARRRRRSGDGPAADSRSSALSATTTRLRIASSKCKSLI